MKDLAIEFINNKDPKDPKYIITYSYPGLPDEEIRLIEFENVRKNMYYISSYGRVFTIYGKEIFPYEEYIGNNIYLRITLQCEQKGTEKKFFVHRLVAGVFIPRTTNDIIMGRNYVNHKYNLDGRCNFVWNLEWCTIQENTIHAMQNIGYCRNKNIVPSNIKRNTSSRGQNNPRSRLSEYLVHVICQYIQSDPNMSNHDICIKIGLDGNNRDCQLIQSIRARRTWTYISDQYIWNY